jgi:hypothetical protein
MSNEKQKGGEAKPKKADGTDSSELDEQNLDDVSGGMAGLSPAIPDLGSAGLSSLETAKCISQ